MAELYTWYGLLPEVIDDVMEHYGMDWDDNKLKVSASSPDGYGNTEWWVMIGDDGTVSIMYALNAHKYEPNPNKVDGLPVMNLITDYFREREQVMFEAMSEEGALDE